MGTEEAMGGLANRSFRYMATILSLAFTPVAAVLARTQRAASARRVDPVPDGVLNHK
jgi:hypothetical protein